MEKLAIKGDQTTCPVIGLIRDGAIIIGFRHYRKKDDSILSVWTVPGGRCDDEETIEICLRREVAEEIGIKNFEIIDFLGEIPGAKLGDKVLAYVGQTKENPQLMEPEKFSEWKWQSLANVPENFINPEFLERMQRFAQKSKT